MVTRACGAVKRDGKLCKAMPMRDADFCFMHNPETEEEAADARRLGGVRRKREKTLAGAYDFDGFDGPDSVRRILDIATFDALALDSSIARIRTLIAAAGAAAKLLETGDLQTRIELLEATLRSRRSMDPEDFDSALLEAG
jgi:hypothetical protein